MARIGTPVESVLQWKRVALKNNQLGESPHALLEQLKPGGRMVIPFGLPDSQQLMLVEKNAQSAINTEEILPVLFGPLILLH